MPLDAAPTLSGNLLERQLADIDNVITFLGDERSWVQGATVRGYRMCTDQTLTELKVRHLEAHILYAAQEVTGFAYNSIPLFNDASATTHDVLMEAFRQARNNILAGVVPICPAPRTIEPLSSSPQKRPINCSARHTAGLFYL